MQNVSVHNIYMCVFMFLHVEWSIIRLSPEMAYSRYEHRARLALPITTESDKTGLFRPTLLTTKPHILPK